MKSVSPSLESRLAYGYLANRVKHIILNLSLVFKSTSSSRLYLWNHTYYGGGLAAQLCPTLMTPWTVACLCPWYSQRKGTGVG